MIVLDQLVDDASLLEPNGRRVPDLLGAFLGGQLLDQSEQLGCLLVSDRELVAVSRLLPADRLLPTAVVNSGGAGGLLGLAGRCPTSLHLRAVESPLRDLDDLAGAAARVVAAARELDGDTRVFVELPYAPGWQRAIEILEADAMLAKITISGPTAVAVEQLSALVEADLPFKVGGLPPEAALHLILVVHALVEGAAPATALEMWTEAVVSECVRTIAGWDDPTQQRVRRRLVACDTTDVRASLRLLASAKEAYASRHA